MDFLTDVESIQARVRPELSRAPDGDGRDAERSILLLNEALALTMTCVLRHMRHFVTADRFNARMVAQEFLEHTVRESEHSDLIVARIRALGGAMLFDRHSVTSRGPFICDSMSEFEDIIRRDLHAERAAIETYSRIIAWLASVDPVSSSLLEQIRSLEEEHAEAMSNFVAVVVVD